MKWFLFSLAVLATFATTVQAADPPKVDDSAWRFTTEKPADGWEKSDFDASAWQEGPGGFGTRGTPGSRVGTEWSTDDIWLRKTIKVETLPAKPALYVYHDEDCEVFLNGQQVLTLPGYFGEYQVHALKTEGSPLKAGENVMAIHCHQSTGGQFIDAHLIDADHIPKLPRPTRDPKPYESKLITRWGKEVTAENAWQEYPRPQMERENWTNLNGNWDYAVTDRDMQEVPKEWAGQILVPFCPESKLSGVSRLIEPTETLWYHRELTAKPTPGRRTILHFEAVDYRTKVWVNENDGR